jgi:hypothetical protein
LLVRTWIDGITCFGGSTIRPYDWWKVYSFLSAAFASRFSSVLNFGKFVILRIVCLVFHYTTTFLCDLHTWFGAFVVCSHFYSTKIYSRVSIVYRCVISGIVGHLWLHVSWKRLLWCLILLGELWIMFTQRFSFICSYINRVWKRLDAFNLIKSMFCNTLNTLTVWKPLIIFKLWIIFI